MKVAGLDYSSRAVDVVLLDEDSDAAVWHRFDVADRRGTFYAARNVRPAMPPRSWWQDEGVYLIGIEGRYRGLTNAVRAMSLIEGAILSCLPPLLVVVETPEEEWKREFTGRAKASKEEVQAECVLRGFDPELAVTSDPYDAYGVAFAVRKLNRAAIGAVA